MHELPVTERILDVALKHASGNDVNKIVRIHLRIGELTDLEDEWIQHYFDFLSKGTLAEKAELVIERAPIVVECVSCDHSFEISKKELGEVVCPECNEKRPRLKSGKEYFVKNMEVV